MIIKIHPDKQRALSLYKMAKNRIGTMDKLKRIGYPTMVAETYYEIIKELISAILFVRGKKTMGENAHKGLIQEISKEDILDSFEINIINDLRIKRNNSYYVGKQIEEIFLDNHSKKLDKIIEKLKSYLYKIFK